MNKVIFHLLDIQTRDVCIDEEQKVVYESNSDDEAPKKKTYNKGQRELVIHLFGVTESGQQLRCDVTGFRPTFYLRLPEERTTSVIDLIKGYMSSKGIPMGLVSIKRVTKKIFYGFTANTSYPFLQIDVPSLALFRTLRGLFLDDLLRPKSIDGFRGKIEVYEANIDPMLRFLHTQNIQPCGWVSLPCPKGVLDKELKETLILECEYDDVEPAQAPCVSAPFLTASWDIECFSMTGDFPVPIRTWNKTATELAELAHTKEEAVQLVMQSLTQTQYAPDTLPKGMTAIYCDFKKRTLAKDIEKKLTDSEWDEALGDAENIEKILKKLPVELKGDPVIQIGTTLMRGNVLDRHLFVFPDCADIPGITIHAYPTEEKMIEEWFRWLVLENPDILIGYNIFGFDESYLWKRAEVLGCISDEVHGLTRLNDCGSEMKLEEKFLSSSAMGDNQMYIWSMHGRLQIDMFFYIKRNNVLPSYKLDEVTKHFMSGKLKQVAYEDGLLTLEVGGAVQDVKEGRSIMLLDDTGETVSEKLVVVSIADGRITVECELDEDALAEIQTATKWVIVKDDVSPADIFRLHRGSAADRAVVGKYCLQDCDLVIELYKKLETFNNCMSMANVCTVPISYIFVRGQGIKIESLIFKYCREKGIVIPVLEQSRGSDDSYEGAIVLDPEPGFYATSPVGVCDFASLYPSTIISENISHDSLVWVKDFTDDGALITHQWGSEVYDECEGYAYTDIEYDIIRPDPADHRKNPAKIKCGRRICRFAQPLDGSKSTLPQITSWLLKARSAKKKEMKSEKDPERYALLDAEQLAYKLTGNSLYGQLGSGTFKIRLQALAASVTAYGRKQILFAKDAIDKFYGAGAEDPRCAARCMAKVVYGDSIAGDTKVEVRSCGREYQIPVEGLESLEDGAWLSYHDSEKDEDDKEYYELKDTYSWTETGWTPVQRIIRHKLHHTKKMYRVYIKIGSKMEYIDVTGDHSLLTSNGVMIKPTELRSGMRLLSTHMNGAIYVRSEEIEYEGYVYDLTTANHHFQAGPDGLIVHNTDSLFVEFNPRNPETGERLEGREARQATIDITGEAGHFISKVLAAPHDFEFDKAFDPLLMFSKKRYAGNMYENNADDYVHKYMGIALKRRDNAPIVKTIFGGAMRMLLDKRDVVGAFQFVKEKCLDLVNGKVSLGQLTVTKSLRASYANPDQIAHKVLADRITMRDPGNAPASGDRIGYVYIRPKAGQEAAALQGDRIETPGFIKENQLVPDYRHYIEHQLQNPISQAFALLLESIPGFNADLLRGCPPVKDLDRYLGFREGKAADLLFTDCLRRFENVAKRSAMVSMFGGRCTASLTSTASSTTSSLKRANVVADAASAIIGLTNVESVSAASKSDEKEKEKPVKQVQKKISGFLLDSLIVSGIKKKDREKAKELKEAKEQKEEKEAVRAVKAVKAVK